VEQLSEDRPGEVVAGDVQETLADHMGVDYERAEELFAEATDRGVIVETDPDGDDGGFGAVRLTESNPGDASPEDDGTNDANPGGETRESASGGGVTFRDVYLRAADLADRETWEYVEEDAIRTAFKNSGFGHLLENPGLGALGDWMFADISDEDEEEERPAWYCPSENEPRPDEFRRFHSLLMKNAPEGYQPHYFKVAKASKDPATQFGSWKKPDAQLSVSEAVEWMQQGGNVGLAGRGPCEGCGGRQSEYCDVCEGEEVEDALINIDIDDDEETSPGDIPETLRATSRSRTGWHGWGFNHERDIPNIPTEDYGETRTDWQYVVAPGSFVASQSEEMPEDATDQGYYTVADAKPVADIEYDDLPSVFHEAHRAQQIAETEQEARSQDVDVGARNGTGTKTGTRTGTVDTENPLYDFDATALCSHTDPSDRFASIFHDSSTSSNMSVSDSHELVTCWRHNCSHGGLQALCVLSNVAHVSGFGCGDLGAAHKNSGAGPNRLKGDWRLVWGAWHEAKRRGIIARDNTIPYRVMRELAVADDVVDREDLVERDSETGEVVAPEDREDHEGDTYTALPSGSYNEVLLHIEGTYGVQTGREPVATSAFQMFLPQGVRNLAQQKTSGWDWRQSGATSESDLTIEDARRRTVGALEDAYESSDRVLIEALPTMGKSYGSIKAAAETGEAITVVTGRGREEQYEQFQEWADEHDISTYTLPSFSEDCGTANCDDQEWRNRVWGWYQRGATPKTIHKHAEDVLGRPLPCQAKEGCSCAYASKWDFDPDDYDVLIGHYSHAHKPKVTTGRTVVIDEFPDGAYETELGESEHETETGRGFELNGEVTYPLPRVVSTWLERTCGVPYESYTDLIESRDDEQRREKALEWFEENETPRDELGVLRFNKGHAMAPSAVFALLTCEDLGNGVEHARLNNDGRRAQYNREKVELSILRPPDLQYASGVVALDGTPTVDLWELCLGERLNHRPVLQDDERAEYLTQALNLNLIRTSEYIKTYNSSEYVNLRSDGALLDEIESIHGEKAGVITTSTAESKYISTDESLAIAETKHYGNVLGSNEFAEKRVGAVIGSNHYGDDFVKKWAAYAGEVAERDGKGTDLEYGEFGNRVLRHMREHDTLQAAMRFGRDGNGAVVYVHTNTLPDWVEENALAGEGRVLKTWSEGMRSVIDALEVLESPTTEDVADYPGVDIGRRQVFDHLETLRQKGVLSRGRDSDDGRRFVWFDDGLHRIGDHGSAELPTLDVTDEEDVSEEEVEELSRISLYTCEFQQIASVGGSKGDETEPTAGATHSPTVEAVDSGEPPG
jgi:hypothetical protein